MKADQAVPARCRVIVGARRALRVDAELAASFASSVFSVKADELVGNVLVVDVVLSKTNRGTWPWLWQ